MSQLDLDFVRAQFPALSTPALSWEELRVHPVLMQRPCSVHTLVNEDAVVSENAFHHLDRRIANHLVAA